MKTSFLNILYVLISDISDIRAKLLLEYYDVDYVIKPLCTKTGAFSGVRCVDFILSSRRIHSKVVYPRSPYFIDILNTDLSLPSEKRSYRFVRFTFREQSKDGLTREILTLWY